MPKLRWSVVLFDLDGTLANTIDLVVASYGAAFAVIGRTVEREQAKHWIGETLAQTFAREAPDDGAAMEAAYRDNYDAHLDDIRRYPGVPELLDDLKAAGAITGVVTAKRRAVAAVTMQRAGVAGRIDLVGAMEDSALHKPDPEPLLVAAAKLGATPRDCVYVGDAVHDIEAAHAAGMAVIAVTWGAGVRDELVALHPDALCDDADALRAALVTWE